MVGGGGGGVGNNGVKWRVYECVGGGVGWGSGS